VSIWSGWRFQPSKENTNKGLNISNISPPTGCMTPTSDPTNFQKSRLVFTQNSTAFLDLMSKKIQQESPTASLFLLKTLQFLMIFPWK
jgi:hypothetical protein